MEQSSTKLMDQMPVGAVMVVGGGIAGMQASLDLADQGFKVYLVEVKSAIGGKMAQLDKTFPTNDCAMCTISPKLVETGSHPNIEVLTNTELMDMTGQAGDFTVRLKHKPRYVDPERCVACGDCVQVCPITVMDTFEEGLISQKAIYKLYPQAVPNAFVINKRGIAPCRDACPAGQRAQGYIALIHEGRWQDAMRVIKLDNPFPGICGRICNHTCEDACSRGMVDEPINIRALKRFVTDKVYAEARGPIEPALRRFKQHVAIIGAGPCGLTAAQDLVTEGFGVTVFEAMPVAGGMLRLGVPEYRLPTEIIEREVQDIVDLGVDLRLGHRVDDLDQLFEDGYDAVLVAVGAHEGVRLPIPGANLEGVLVNTHFLRDVRLGKYQLGENGAKPTDGAPELGDQVLVLGGGNVAIDCARTAVRLGCEVHLACLEQRDEMPAHKWEVDAAEEEGVVLHTGRSFEQILGNETGRLTGVECKQVESFYFDESGRLFVEKIPGSDHVLPCDTVIFSVGQRAGLAFIPDDTQVSLTDHQTIQVDPDTLATSLPGVFAAGDCISGTAFVIEAVDRGHTAARSISRYLRGESLETLPEPDLPVARFTQQEIDERVARGEIRRQPRIAMPEIPIENRTGNFVEVEGGFDDASAQAEAARCLACGICSECMSCVYACGRDAIIHDEAECTSEVKVGGVILAPGYQVYRAELSEEYGLGRFPNVVTALQYERMLSASGPTQGHVLRVSDNKKPKRIAFLQCVGSRDQSHDYCSSVCCMYAAKEAIMTVEHARASSHGANGDGDVSCEVFFMDTRAYSKGYEEYYRRAEKKYGIKYTRCRISDVKEDPQNQNLIVRYAAPFEGQSAILEKEFDLVVLSVGMEISESVRQLGNRLEIQLDPYGFCHTTLFDPLRTSRPGIYVAGPFREPKDIPETVTEASGAAAAAARMLAPSRHTLAQLQEYPPERDITGEDTRIGVFVCHCGSNIGGFLDVPAVAEDAKSLPGVVYAEDNLYTCSQDTIAHIIEQVKTLNLNRVVVASCTPLTHEPLFQDALRQAGLNPHMFEMANIRNQCSWVHSENWEGATAKANDLVRMSIARAAQLEPLKTTEFDVNNTALIIGGGVAGMSAALNIADQGFPVHLIERSSRLGGNLRNIRFFVPPNGRTGMAKEWSPQEYLTDIVSRVLVNPQIKVHLHTELVETVGFKGNFTSTLNRENREFQVDHGVIIVATGGKEYKGPEYGYGQDPRILTQLEFESFLGEKHLEALDREEANLFERQAGSLSPANTAAKLPESIVMILCVGPAERYCSRLCCTTALKNALKIKELNPDCQVTIIYRDIRTFGFKERLYTKARREGVRFLHYDFDQKPEVKIAPAGQADGENGLQIKIWEPVLSRHLVLSPDLLVLSNPVVPPEGMRDLASRLKLSIDMDGFFLEAHVKLRPVDFSTEGVYMAGSAHYPKFLDETIAQAQAAASRAAIVLSQPKMVTNARVAVVDPSLCVGCLTCVRICPYGVPSVVSNFTGIGDITGAAFIEAAVCHGCGTCASECPAQAIQLKHYTDQQTVNKVDALFHKWAPKAGLISVDDIRIEES